MSLPRNALSLKADVKLDDAVPEKASGSGAELNFATRTACQQLPVSTKPVGMVYKVPFQNLLELVDLYVGDISKGVHDMICDMLYNTPWIVELSNSKHDRLRL